MRRKIFPIIFLALSMVLGYSAKASAKDIAIDETNFPDPGLREYVQTAYDANKDGVLSDEENAAAKEMNVYFNEDPKLMISIREDNTYNHYDLGKWKVRKEFPCDQIAENPLSPYDEAYVVGSYPWECVINQPAKSWKGLELLTNLQDMTVGGATPKKMVIKNLKHLKRLELGGDTSVFDRVYVKKCPQLSGVAFSRTNTLRKIDLSKISESLRYVWQTEYKDTSILDLGKKWKTLDSLIIGKAPRLRAVRARISPIKKWKIEYSSLMRLNELNIWLEDGKEDIDLSSCKKLYTVTILGKYHKIILPNKELAPEQEDRDDWRRDFPIIFISFGSQDGPKILDLSKSTRADDYADEYIFPELMRKLKKGKVRTKTLIVSKKMYDNRWNTLRLLRKRGIKVQVR